VHQHFLRFAAEQYALDAFTSVRGHDDQVALALFRRLQDRFVGVVGSQLAGRARHAGAACGVGDHLQELPRHAIGPGCELFRGVFEHFGIVGQGMELGQHGQPDNLRADFLGKTDAGKDCPFGQVRAVRR
jgi:hypothetical protein